MLNEKQLKAFSDDVIKIYEQGKIKAPIHLSDGSEKPLIHIFKKLYKKDDWIFTNWRSHFHWLLSGRSPKKLKKQILDGYSMHVFDKKFFTSSIVAGISPIALGVAYALKLKKSKSKVLCFLGDMGASTGLAHECFRFAEGYSLPIKYVVENNRFSVATNTEESWGLLYKNVRDEYYYERKYNHAGIGENGKTKFILF